MNFSQKDQEINKLKKRVRDLEDQIFDLDQKFPEERIPNGNKRKDVGITPE